MLQLDEETGLDKQGDQLIDPGCVVVPPPSVHIAAECKRQGWLALLAGVELVVDIVRCVGARHVWFVKSDEGIGFILGTLVRYSQEQPLEAQGAYQEGGTREGGERIAIRHVSRDEVYKPRRNDLSAFNLPAPSPR